MGALDHSLPPRGQRPRSLGARQRNRVARRNGWTRSGPVMTLDFPRRAVAVVQQHEDGSAGRPVPSRFDRGCESARAAPLASQQGRCSGIGKAGPPAAETRAFVPRLVISPSDEPPDRAGQARLAAIEASVG